ncbi:MAG: hypothetical protein IPM57_06650 [Oligoflexia bacterium]|nr:hypothetical protein [Oligoflexia bacterium]
MKLKFKTFYFWIIIFILLLSTSAWFAYKNIYQKKQVSITPVVVDVPASEPAVVATPFVNNNPQLTCDEQPEYKKWRRELGRIVNDRYIRQNKKKKFLNDLEKWRKKYGIPLSIGVDAAEALNKQIVFNNCRPAFSGKVHQVFLSELMSNKAAILLNKKGKLQKFAIPTSGLRIVTIDELNKKGVPFRSWFLPVDEGMFYIKGNDLFLSLDIEDVWLKVSSKGKWSLSLSDKKAIKLEKVDPLTVTGCIVEEECFKAKDRSFKRSF